MKIVVIDGDQTRTRNLRTALSNIGHSAADIMSCSTLNEAKETLRKNRFDICFLSLELDGESNGGIGLLEDIRADIRLQKLPVILVSAQATPDNIKAASAAGVSGFLGYPFSAGDVENLVQHVQKG